VPLNVLLGGGKTLNCYSSTQVRKQSVGIVPEDRHDEALLLSESVPLNVLLGHQQKKQFQTRRWFGIQWISMHRLVSVSKKIIEHFDVRPRRLDQPLRSYSGGNQQKVILGRELEYAPEFLLICQPTRGVDVGAIETIHYQILKARDAGAAILLVSSELDEVLALSDRLQVFYRGQVQGEMRRKEFDRNRIGLWMGGAQV
jgi:simple sugar transport system ATP-binding protein